MMLLVKATITGILEVDHYYISEEQFHDIMQGFTTRSAAAIIVIMDYGLVPEEINKSPLLYDC